MGEDLEPSLFVGDPMLISYAIFTRGPSGLRP